MDDLAHKPKPDVITSIEKQKKPGRYSLYINDHYSFSVDEQVLIDFMLRKGQQISKELQDQLLAADRLQQAYQLALTYISYQLRSEREVRDRLSQEQISESQLESIIDKLKRLSVVDDLAFAQSFVRTKASINRHGPQQIKMKLFQKGVDESTIDLALEEYGKDQQQDNARYWADKQKKKYKGDSSLQAEQKLKQFLMQKGFSPAIIQSLGQELAVDKSEEEEYQALIKQGEKAWRRYEKHGLKSCKVKTMRNLYAKAFSSSLIQKFIDEKESEWHDEHQEFD